MRQISGADALIGNILIVNFVAAVTTIMVVPFVFPGANVPLAVLLAMVPSFALATVYVLFALAMPRSGGEYVYVSRVFHPAVGFAANFSFTVWNILFGGLLVHQFTSVYLSSFCTSIGWTAGANAASETWVILAVGAVLILATTIPVMWGTRLAMRAMKATFYIGAVLLGITLVVLAVRGHDAFVSSVNEQASYQGVINEARGNEAAGGGTSLSSTLQAVALISLTTLFVVSSTYTTGEVEDVRRSVPRAVYGSALIGGLAVALMAFLATQVWGTDFLAAAGSLADAGPASYPLEQEPSFAYFSVLTQGGWPFAVAVNLSFLCLIVGNLLFGTVTISRCLAAWSMDGIGPSRLGKLNARHRTPRNAVAAFTVLSLAALVYYAFNDNVTFLAGATLGFISTFLTVAAAAIVFPYRRREQYEGSAADRRVLRLPAIAVAGAATALLLGAMVAAFLANDAFDANGITGLLFLGGYWVLGLALFAAYRARRRRQGVPFDLAFKELSAR
ncbi:APC family permease [Streptomyces sp. NBC_01506]|uniref:APC family permease n=1 Tax=Streptomyces sp. NBC_01506 TaxID=2903887 RepID=UPI00386D84D6